MEPDSSPLVQNDRGILVIDFGSQTSHLIARRLRQLGCATKLITPEVALEEINAFHSTSSGQASSSNKIKGIILSGGPMSVYEKNAPTIDKKIFTLDIPILGICYGFQLIGHLLGGKVISGRKEYGPAKFTVLDKKTPLLKGVAKESTVWMNHGDELVTMPKDFTLLGLTAHVPSTCMVSNQRNIYGVLFHPEVEHTEYGMQILANFVEICNVIPAKAGIQEKNGSRIPTSQKASTQRGEQVQHDNLNTQAMIQQIKDIVGDVHVIGAVSGGVDSTVAATLVAKAIGKKFTPIFVNNGLMRDDAVESVKSLFKKLKITPIIAEVEKEMLQRLKGVTDSEEKRKVIGKFYIDVFEREMTKLLKKNKDVQFLLQGTIYSDVIESQGTKHASKIKSHHNVGGLPERMKLKLLEPLRELYKDEVRALGRKLKLPESFVAKQPFPGPGYAVRIRGEVTSERLSQEKHADKIVLEELGKAGILPKIFISFPVMTGADSTAVKGDAKFMGEVIALRVVESKDIMTATWSRVPYDTLQKISSRIVNEVPHISRVVYDITTKPPATMEWE